MLKVIVIKSKSCKLAETQIVKNKNIHLAKQELNFALRQGAKKEQVLFSFQNTFSVLSISIKSCPLKIPSFDIRLLAAIFLIIAFICFKQDEDKISIFSIGDSTMAEYNIEKLSVQYEGENYPLRGWMMMQDLFSDHEKMSIPRQNGT